MRKIIAAAHLTLDGVMQGPGGAQEDASEGFDLGGWSMNYSDEKAGPTIMSLVGTPAKPNDLLLGRRTYDIFAGYWPHVPPDNRIGAAFTRAHKYVVTSRAAPLAWANSHALGKGKKLFGSTSHPVRMKLVNSEATSTGVILATYDQAG